MPDVADNPDVLLRNSRSPRLLGHGFQHNAPAKTLEDCRAEQEEIRWSPVS
jgi:hypothetical protein